MSFRFRRSQFAGIVLGIASFGALATSAMADIAFVAPGGAPETTNWNPADVNLGLVFTANSNLLVNSLGVYYQGSNIPTNGSEMVGLYDHSGSLLASTTVTFASGSPGYQFTAITPVQLTAGLQYTVDAYTGGNSWAYGTTPTPDPRITYEGSTYVYTGSLAFPTGTFFGAATSYYGPNLEISSSAAAPEPTYFGIMVLMVGLLALASYLRRRSKAVSN